MSDREPLIVKVEFKGQEEIERMLMNMAAKGQNLRPVFEDFKGRMQRSITLNFQQGGRPEAWKISKRAKGQGRGRNKTGQTLLDTKILCNSLIGPSLNGKCIVDTDSLEIATNVPYAATHQYGAKKGSFGTFTAKVREHNRTIGSKICKVKAHTRKINLPWGDIPARPFLLVQDSDMNYLKKAIIKHLRSGGGTGGSTIGDITTGES